MSLVKWTTAAASVALATTVAAAVTEIRLRIPDETVPPGGMVQMKVLTTEVTPISGGRPSLTYDSTVFSAVAGFGIQSQNGEVAGAAVIDANHVQISYSGTELLSANYPILTVVLPVRADAKRGTRTIFTLDSASLWDLATLGTTAAKINPASVFIGGSTSITDVVPGEGLWPAGTVVSVFGTGFDEKTALRVADASVKTYAVVSPTELQFVLSQPTEMRGQKIVVSGQTNSATYYSYMRGIPMATSARTLLAMTEPIFSTAQRQVATLGPFGSMAASQYAGVALQNPNFSDVTVTLSLVAADRTPLRNVAITLPTRNRLALEVTELLGVAPEPGSTLVVNASAPIDAFSLLVDEGAWTVEPVLPIEARP